MPTRKDIAKLICKRLNELNIEQLRTKYINSSIINYLIIDNLLPKELASELSYIFTPEAKLTHLDKIQEKKFVGVNIEKGRKLIEETLYSFQEDNVIKLISKITDIKDLEGDKFLYAGGISSMSKGCFLNPHIDNSHDKDMERYRRLNLLYYVNEEWDCKHDGGELVLYPKGIKNEATKIPPIFNNLIIMRTDKKSLHGVLPIKSSINRRKCISNYYFSNSSPNNYEYYHSTSFTGFKNQIFKKVFLEANAKSRTLIKKLIKKTLNISITTGHFIGGKGRLDK